MFRLIVAIVATVVGSVASAEEHKQVTDTPAAIEQIESEILRSMGNMGASVAELRKQFRSLAPETRRRLNVTIRPDVFQWRFHGVFPADELQAGMLEYVASPESKAYESLLVVEGHELARLRRFGEASNALRRRFPDAELSVQLCWSEEGRVRTVDLWEVLALHKVDQIERFIANLQGKQELGFGGSMNLAADPAALPKKKTPAQVAFTLRIPR